MKKSSFDINGMHCAGCVNSVEKALKNIEGVADVQVHLMTNKAIVEWNESTAGPEEFKKAVKRAGFELELPKTEPLIFTIEGMHCAGCTNSVEKAIAGVEGVQNVTVTLTTDRAVVDAEPTVSIEEIILKIKKAGYSASLDDRNQSSRSALGEKREKEKKKIETVRQKMMLSWGVTLPLMIWMFLDMVLGLPLANHTVMELVMTTGAGFVLFGPGMETLKSAWASSKNLAPNMDVLIALGTVASLITGLAALGYHLGLIPSQFYSFAGIAAMIMAFHLTGRYVETKARGRASEAITRLLTLEAKTARIIKNGKEMEVPADELRKGDTAIIRPGETIPADGKVIDGRGSVDEAMVTGEPLPATRQEGDEVIGGTINTEGTLRVQITGVGEDTFLSRVIRLVEDAQGSKIPIQDFADKITAVFVPIILALALITFATWWVFPETFRPLLEWADAFVPWIVTDLEPLSQAFFVALAVLVIACPCALGLATPTALMVGSGLGAENGILIRKGEAIQRLQEVTTFVFDKTGTLTKGEPKVTDWITLDGDETELKNWMAAVEYNSEHPLGKAVTQYVGANNPPGVSAFESFTGMGVKGTIDGKTILAGNQELLNHFGISLNQTVRKKADDLLSEGKTTLFLVVDKSIHGIIGITDTLKEQTRGVIRQIHEMGFKTVMLTGDQKKAAEQIALQIGIDDVIAEVKPGQKADAVRNLQDRGEIVAMVGDGVNDAPALSQADVGIALGTGTDIAIESGSVILIDGNPETLIRAINLSRETFKKIRQNLFWAFFYNIVMLPVAMVGWMHPVLAEMAMAMSSINVVGNSRRLQKKWLG